MKVLNKKFIGLLAATMLFYGCEKDDDTLDTMQVKENGISEECYTVTFENGVSYDGDDFVNGVSVSGFGTISIYNQARVEANGLDPDNRAMIFNTGSPTGDDADLRADWGNVLIIQELEKDPYNDPTIPDDGNHPEDGPNDNRWGGQMLLTFPEPVMVTSLRVLDIDEYEDASYVYLLDGGGNVLATEELEPLGNNSKQTISFNNGAGVEGVTAIRVELNGTGTDVNRVGSGAIDNISFCVPEEVEEGCTRTQGYWKTHSGVGNGNNGKGKGNGKGAKFDPIWTNYLNAELGDLGKYPDILWTAPKGGNAEIILAHQYIAAVLNVASGASAPDDVDDAMQFTEEYFNDEREASRADLLEWAEILDRYNNGLIGPGHCDD